MQHLNVVSSESSNALGRMYCRLVDFRKQAAIVDAHLRSFGPGVLKGDDDSSFEQLTASLATARSDDSRSVELRVREAEAEYARLRDAFMSASVCVHGVDQAHKEGELYKALFAGLQRAKEVCDQMEAACLQGRITHGLFISCGSSEK
jgi:hypothetical protein